MDGGSENDSYYVHDLGDTVVEGLSNGTDTVYSYYLTSYTLGANVENLVLSSSQDPTLNGTGNSLSNSIYGNGANNVLSGLGGNDFLDGGGGEDRLEGGSGKDFLYGFSGNDSLIGGSGNDFLLGGMGRDTLTGGSGKDSFGFETPLYGIDTIKDFAVVDDVVWVADTFGGGLTGNAVLKVDQFRIGSSAQDSSDRFIYNKSTGALYFDSDGIGGLAQIQFAKLSTGLAMTHRNIYVES
nr:calcium-binding protein [Leptolyngbya sp. FACHB-541]